MKFLGVMVLCALAISAVIHPGTFTSAQTVQGQVPLIAGNWKLNAEKSNLRLPPDAVEIRQYRMRPDGFLVGLLITSNAQGYHYLQFTAKSDGKDYPEYTETILADMIAAGKRKGAARPWLGMGTEQMHGMLIVTRVSPEGPAAAAGVETGDVVIGVSNVAVNSQAELYRKVWGLGDAGVKVPLRLRRGTTVRDVVVDSIERTTYFRESVRQ